MRKYLARLLKVAALERSSAPGSDDQAAYPKNVEGPFFVEDGACLTCGVAEAIAPELFENDRDADDGHCYVKRQPESAAELSLALDAMEGCVAKCILYRGDSPRVVEKLKERGLDTQIARNSRSSCD